MELQTALRDALALPEARGPMGAAVRAILEEALRARASDVHLDPSPRGLSVHFRLDGVLQPVAVVEPRHAEQLVGKVKVLAGLLTYRRDAPQDGRIPPADSAGAGDARVAVFPTVDGEKVVIRLFSDSSGMRAAADLGFPADVTRRLEAWARRPEGVALLTGPSGSGKTTTIYALIEEARRGPDGRRHIVTIEDPVERRIEGVTQTQVNAPAGLTFAGSLRSLLRHDPEVIVVGEIRDRETAATAMEAGLTGHLVISTIHAGTAVGVITRLVEMAVAPHVVTSALTGALAQRLARRICAACARQGCGECRGTGYRGRIVFGELLEMTEPLRAAVLSGADRSELRRVSGGETLRDAAEALVRDGATTAEEVARLLGEPVR